jgi:hypothetical protein
VFGNQIDHIIPWRAVKASSRQKGEATDVECIKKKSGVKQLFHQLPRDDSLSLRSMSPPAGPKSAWFYVIREVGAPCRICHIRSFLAVKLLHMCHLKHYST